MRVLVIAAHPDDEVLGCGGTIARLSQEGHEVHIAILGEGISSRYKDRQQADARLIENLRQHAQEVGSMLGAKSVSLHGLPDNRFDTLALLDVAKIVEEMVERVRPESVYTHNASDLNVDHEVVNRAVLTATRPVQGQCVRSIYTFEVASSTEWAFHQRHTLFRPNVFMDITDTVDLKVQAMRHYESEVRAFPHPRSPEAIYANAHRWGSVAGLAAAEPFELVRAISDRKK